MPSHYTAPEMLLLTDTKFKQELNTEYNYKATEKHVISMVLDVEKGLFSIQETTTNGCKEWHSLRRDMTKGELEVYSGFFFFLNKV